MSLESKLELNTIAADKLTDAIERLINTLTLQTATPVEASAPELKKTTKPATKPKKVESTPVEESTPPTTATRGDVVKSLQEVIASVEAKGGTAKQGQLEGLAILEKLAGVRKVPDLQPEQFQTIILACEERVNELQSAA